MHVKTQVAIAIADEHLLAKIQKENAAKVADWMRKAEMAVDKEKDDHLKDTCDALLHHFKRQPFERLIFGGPREVVTDFEAKLHHYLSERLAGRVEVDVEHSNVNQVLEAARPLIDELEERRERDALERLGERGVMGLENVLPPLTERRSGHLVACYFPGEF